MFGEEDPYYKKDYHSTAEQRQTWWDTASGLQAVDGLVIPKYASDNAERYICGDISSAQAVQNVEDKYLGQPAEREEREAAVVATRILQVIEEGQFDLSARKLAALHARLFKGVFERVIPGTFRDYDIYKPEPVLGGRSVHYAPHAEIADSLNYDMGQELAARRRAPFTADVVPGFSAFIGGIWQIHPFGEGNTRTVATFAVLYLRKLGVSVGNDPFKTHSVFFRDALVRASYEDYEADIWRDRSYLDLFFTKAALDASVDLSGIDMNVRGKRPARGDDEFIPEGEGMAYRGPYADEGGQA